MSYTRSSQKMTKPFHSQLETDETKIAIINNNIGFTQKDILEIKISLREAYATKEAVATMGAFNFI